MDKSVNRKSDIFKTVPNINVISKKILLTIARNQFDGTWFPSESSLSNIVLSEVKNGKMKRISNGRLCATDSKMNW